MHGRLRAGDIHPAQDHKYIFVLLHLSACQMELVGARPQLLASCMQQLLRQQQLSILQKSITTHMVGMPILRQTNSTCLELLDAGSQDVHICTARFWLL